MARSGFRVDNIEDDEWDEELEEDDDGLGEETDHGDDDPDPEADFQGLMQMREAP